MLSLERFAELRAAIETRGARDAVLAEAGLSPKAWSALQTRWLDALADEVARGKTTLARRYASAFDRAFGPPPALETPAAPLPAPEVPAFAPPASSMPVGSMPVGAMPVAPAPAYGDYAPPRVYPPPPTAQPAQAPSMGTGTVLTLDAPQRPATPFQPNSAESKRVAPGTAWAAPESAAEPLPFQSGGGEFTAFPLARYAELVAARQERGANLTSVYSRFGLDENTHGRLEAHWQARLAQNGMLALELERHFNLAKKALAAKQGPKVGTGTALVDPEVQQKALAAAQAKASPPAAPAQSPVQPQADAGLPDMSVEQYAWLVATLRKAPAHAMSETLARFRLTEEQKTRLETLWRERMSADPKVRETFTAALARHLMGPRP